MLLQLIVIPNNLTVVKHSVIANGMNMNNLLIALLHLIKQRVKMLPILLVPGMVLHVEIVHVMVKLMK
jgi:hypothetical protein